MVLWTKPRWSESLVRQHVVTEIQFETMLSCGFNVDMLH